jgi:hypothetical protein
MTAKIESIICRVCGIKTDVDLMVRSGGKPIKVCLACNREKVRQWKENNPKQTSRITTAYGSRNKEKRRAVRAVRKAILEGKMVRPTECSLCGKSGKIEGHHEDYSKKLWVIWVCHSCHTQKHSPRHEKSN